ncbi:MAG: class I SAM-dependent methyltransferase [Pirellulales bacterium]
MGPMQLGHGKEFALGETDVRRHFLALLPTAGVCHAAFRAAEMRHVEAGLLQSPCLDFGCGDGSLAAEWLAGCCDIGIDLNPRQLAQARKAYPLVLAADGVRLPLPDHSLGSVVSISVFEHLEHPAETLAELHRVLRPGGVLVATITLSDLQQQLYWPRVIARGGLPACGKAYVRRQNWLFGHRAMYDQATWKGMLSGAGFQLTAARPIVAPGTVAQWDRRLPAAALGRLLRMACQFCRAANGFPAIAQRGLLSEKKRAHPRLLRRLIRRPRNAWNRSRPAILDDTQPGSVLYIVARKG